MSEPMPDQLPDQMPDQMPEAADPTLVAVAQERHPFQPWSLITGLVVVTVAVLFLLNDGGFAEVDGAVAGAVLLVLAGAASIIRAVVRLIGRQAPG